MEYMFYFILFLKKKSMLVLVINIINFFSGWESSSD
jgi:hypothetical protein